MGPKAFFELNVLRVLGCALALLIALLAVTGEARAQDARARARTHFNQGVAAYESGRYRDALAAFEQAYRAAPHPTVRVNMANCFEQLGQYVEALFNYRRFIEESGENITEEQRAEVEAAVRRLTPKVGMLMIELEPRSASLTIDGKVPKRTPEGGVQLVAGQHTVRAAAPGYEPSEQTVEVAGAVATPLSISLVRESEEPLASEGAEPAESYADEGSAEPPSDEPFEPADEPRGKAYRKVGWTFFGAAVAFGVGAGVAGGIALKADRDFDDAALRSNNEALDRESRETARLEGLQAADKADRSALVSDVFLGAAVVSGLVAGSAALWGLLSNAEPDERARRGVTPVAFGRGAAGLAYGGEF